MAPPGRRHASIRRKCSVLYVQDFNESFSTSKRIYAPAGMPRARCAGIVLLSNPASAQQPVFVEGLRELTAAMMATSGTPRA